MKDSHRSGIQVIVLTTSYAIQTSPQSGRSEKQRRWQGNIEYTHAIFVPFFLFETKVLLFNAIVKTVNPLNGMNNAAING